jgi:rare lipoprotein A
VTNLENDSSIVVTINDRMGNKKRLIDLTKAGAKKLGFIKQGLTKVKIEVINESVVFRP